MQNKLRKIRQYQKILEEQTWKNIKTVENIFAAPCAYKTGHTPPKLTEMSPYTCGTPWGSGIDSHAWFRFTVTPTAPNTFLKIETDKDGWDAKNPQFIIYINGELIQGLDTNHRELPLVNGQSAEVALYAYTGADVPQARLYAHTMELRPSVESLYYDVRYPLELLEALNEENQDYALIVDYLWRAVSMLEMYDLSSPAFEESAERAHRFLTDEFYGKFCNEAEGRTIGIGHTHIDCAWLWTLKQTREKVQRSFATVLSLMKRYPEYKFMSSQAFLYQNLKEEAPELFRQVGERIKEGRWECEGSMWVEADCNLSSGESLVRQVLYGKNFFLDEFGVENRVLWLPDVFGYTAALPQILRKSGVDWFVTSKISWNDTNRMPYDTFRWRGIDGTEINTHFITAQDDHGGPTEKGCTYVCNTGARMVRGTYRRYSQKNLHREAILTFGYGDGGGGPTPTHLELARRASLGVPGAPRFQIDFAGNYLKRLEKSMENRRDIPSWQGELYLEYHRGTYTTMARNKRNNRACEFLYENAELLGVTEKALLGKTFPKKDLHRGWEMILTNQFHDIIPGSSIKEVYDQSDIDYREIKQIGSEVVSGARKTITDKIDRGHGYVVFNPHSFEDRGMVKINGKTVLTREKIPAKGYLATDAFLSENHVSIEDKKVETDRLAVTFNEAWQIVSIYDKKACREVIKAGEIANELRVHADYPDNYDAWEWQAYSAEEYRTLTDVKEVTVIEDGIRRGIRILRPYMNSTVTQTIWFYDGTTRIDFETVADWHERHQMLKVAFPVDINSDKATYEIQFGTVERPTHKNTSWDAARFEVCAHKYADLSEGNYGVAMMNDCKYGHDIHNGVMQLSILRSPTYPNPEADQGEIPVTYSIYPHEGRLNDTNVAKEAYYLNEPMVALEANGERDELPTAFSAVTLDCENVICETVKEAERDEDTVIRLYESRNCRTNVNVKLGIPASRVFLCDLMEREEKELPVTNGSVNLTLGGFEIVTLKVKA